jgi:hypothetical protein
VSGSGGAGDVSGASGSGAAAGSSGASGDAAASNDASGDAAAASSDASGSSAVVCADDDDCAPDSFCLTSSSQCQTLGDHCVFEVTSFDLMGPNGIETKGAEGTGSCTAAGAQPVSCFVADVDGDCRVKVCNDTGTAPAPAVDVGTVNVMVGDTTEFMFTPDGDHAYVSPKPIIGNTAYVGGETVTFVGGAPAWMGVLVAPKSTTMTAPAVSSNTPVNISLNKNFDVTWTPGAANDPTSVQTTVTGMPADGKTFAVISCKKPISAGKVTYTVKVLKWMAPGAAVLSVKSRNVTAITVGTFHMAAIADQSIQVPNGAAIAQSIPAMLGQ